MNKCHFLKELSSYLDNQLSEARKLKLEKHLMECSICSQELAQLKLLSDSLKKWQSPELGPEFEGAVRNTIVQEELEKGEVKMKKKTLAILVPSGVLAGILVFLVVGMQMHEKRAFHGKMRQSVDQIGAAFEPAETRIYKGKPGPNYEMSNVSRRVADLAAGLAAELDGRSGIAKSSMAETKGYYGESLSDTQAERSELPRDSNRIQAPYGQGSVIVIQPVLPATGEGEKIIRTADVRLEVEDGKSAYLQANKICQELGGYLSSSNFYKDTEGREAGTITMRIPKDKFLAALDKLSVLGKVERSSTDSQDVSQEYANLKTQLDTSMIVYNKMLEALQKRQVTIPDAMQLESELTPVRKAIENLRNKIEHLNNAVSFTTINVNFYEARVSTKVLKEAKKEIQQSFLTASINAVKIFANLIKAIPTFIIIFVWLVIVVGAVVLVKYWITRLFKRGE